MTAPGLTVLIPTLDEGARIDRILDDIDALSTVVDLEVVVADGGSRDGTRERARRRGARVVVSGPGRGVQLAAGASKSNGAWLFVVHADCTVQPTARADIVRHLDWGEEDRYAYFRFELDGRGRRFRWVERGQRARERWLGLVYGDQGLLMSRALYERSGGYPAWRVLEDVEILRRLDFAGGQRRRLDASLPTSPRRYEKEGTLSAVARNVRVAASFHLGGDPQRLASAYPADRTVPSRTVVVFAKEPVPGRVKTRLAADIGNDAAARIYRTLGRETVEALHGGGWRIQVFADPPDEGARRRVATWLGVPVEDVRPQIDGDLGARMSAAMEEAFLSSDRVCVVGTDVPDLDIETLDRAFAALDDADVVFGPATDGGYYLVGATAHRPGLFEGIAWSTRSVLSTSLERAREMGARAALLAARTDVDTLADVPRRLLDETAGARSLQQPLRGPPIDTQLGSGPPGPK